MDNRCSSLSLTNKAETSLWEIAGLKTAWPDHWHELVRLVEQRLSAYLEQAGDYPSRLRDGMAYSLLAPAKRLRPLLCLLSCEACGGQAMAAMPLACALEMIHTYSLVHDDLPGMDNDDLRRGLPSCHKQFDEATAILVGDALLTLAFQLVASDLQPAPLAQQVTQQLALAVGGAGMVGGQMDDLLFEKLPAATLTDLESIHSRKTGALFRVSAQMGGLCALHHQSEAERKEILEALKTYADAFGLGFQIVDDLLDVYGKQELMGKSVQKDASRGKLTYPGLLGVTATRERLQLAVDKAKLAAGRLGDSGTPLQMLVQWMAEREK